ncbi:MAG: hypothetical protein Q8M22_13130 [Actinomycetota bacterium]|nr:hypothetical protein [Actinomycetota bacterium]
MSRLRTSAWLVGPVAIAVTVAMVTTGVAAEPVAGSQGTDTSLPLTDSAYTVAGRGAFSDLEITVNQTADLNNQAVSITWTGGTPTLQGPGRFGSQFLQIMQCWGDDDGTVADNPGPPPEQCVQGATTGVAGGLSGVALPGGFATSRVISRSTWSGFDSTVGFLEESTSNVWRPFRAVDGTEVNAHTDPAFNPSIVGGNYWLNPYFNVVTTNEIAGAATGLDGRGAELFEVQTGVQSAGLGCGQRVQPAADGSKVIPRCWIVIVPRGTPDAENVGTPFAERADQFGVYTSPLAPSAWANRIAIPLDFNPVDSPCSLADEERRIAGSELALRAVASWQPALCAGGDLPPYSYAPVSDASARQQLALGAQGSPGMIAVSRPLAGAQLNADDPVVYAPLSVSGLTIGFNIERSLRPDAPADAQQLAGVRIAELNLTPRLAAMLLTQSYAQQVVILRAPDYPWLATNPGHMGVDPDFLAFNPEFELLEISDGRTFSGLQLPAGNSDAAQQVWEWIFADPEARAWMNGEPDEWGMTVNPVYAMSSTVNPTGVAFGEPVPNSFPKGDPYCYQAPPRGAGNSVVPPPVCGTDWMPYARSFADSARVGRVAFDSAKIVENPFATSSSLVWGRGVPQYLGRKAMLVLTDTPSAAQFGLQTARLSRAGDNSDDRAFIAADGAGLVAGVAAMAAGAEATVLEPAPTATAPTAYPLTTLTYAASTPLSLDAEARAEYAAFIDYATGPGQTPGLELGQLPAGYAPLPANLRAQATEAANQIRTMVATPTPPPSTTPTVRPTTGATPRTTRPVTTTPTVTTAPPTTVAPTSTTTTTTVPPVDDEVDEPRPDASPVLTPFVELAHSRYVVPGLGGVALGSALGVLEITKRPRRRRSGDGGVDLLQTMEH